MIKGKKMQETQFWRVNLRSYHGNPPKDLRVINSAAAFWDILIQEDQAKSDYVSKLIKTKRRKRLPGIL